MKRKNLSLYCHLSTENAYATAELDNTVPIIVENEMKIEFFVKIGKVYCPILHL